MICTSPFPFMLMVPRGSMWYPSSFSRASLHWPEMCIFRASPLDSIRLAVLTVSPNRQYRGMVSPTTPATTGPGTLEDNIWLIKPCHITLLFRRRKDLYLCVLRCATLRFHLVCVISCDFSQRPVNPVTWKLFPRRAGRHFVREVPTPENK